MSEFSNPGDVQILNAEIESPNGKKFDITDLIAELNIYESLASPILKGDMMIIDAAGLLANLPVVGQEKITGKIKQNDTIDSFEFYTTNVENIQHVNEFTLKYTISLVDESYYNNLVSLVSESYQGPASEIITRICEDYLDVQVDAEKTDGNFKVVIPNWNPYRAIVWMANRAKNENGVPIVLYNTWRNGMQLKSFESLFKQDPLQTFKYYQRRKDDRTAIRGKSVMAEEIAQTAFILATEKISPTVQVISQGGYSSRTRLVDTCNKQWSVRDFNIEEYFDTAPSLAKKNTISTNYKFKDKTVGNSVAASEKTYLHSSLSFNGNFNDYSGNVLDVIPFRKSYMSRLENYRYKVGINGREDLEVGSIINLEINKNLIAQEQLTDETVDDRRSGKHIVTAVRHQYSVGGNYKMILTACRESMETDL